MNKFDEKLREILANNWKGTCYIDTHLSEEVISELQALIDRAVREERERRVINNGNC